MAKAENSGLHSRIPQGEKTGEDTRNTEFIIEMVICIIREFMTIWR